MDEILEIPHSASAERAVSIDPSDYAADLADLGLSDDQARELLETLWSIMSMMVELGFTHDVCGQIFSEAGLAPLLGGDAVNLRLSEER